MKAKIEIEIEELKDGSYIAKLSDLNLGEIDNINVKDELDRLYNFIEAKELLGKIDFIQDIKPKMDKEFNSQIRQILAKLLAYYYIEEW
jgi:aspartokinase-like uncharacterized kinase